MESVAVKMNNKMGLLIFSEKPFFEITLFVFILKKCYNSQKKEEKRMVNFDSTYHPYPSHRNVVYSKNGMVATSQTLAAQAGLSIMQKGGNAIDAAIATAACLTIVEPTSNGIGGDAFALVWTKGELHGLNASGPTPKSISIEAVKALGHERLPIMGWLPVTVPGVPSAWAELSKRFGKLPLREVLEPAINHARNGFPISPTIAHYWNKSFEIYDAKPDKEKFSTWFETFAPNGRAPKVGEIWKSENHATTLEKIGESNAESFYHGELANKIIKASKEGGGFLTAEDLAEFKPEWVKPISTNYRGYDVWEMPPNGQGVVALSALNILKDFKFSARERIDTVHKQIEAIKLAFTAAQQAITDPQHMNDKHLEYLLGERFANLGKSRINEFASMPEPVDLPKSGTVYLCTADSEGNMVSYIQSNYYGFGSGVVVPETGIALQNRGYDFSLDPNHANCLKGGKRTYHTIIPGFLTKDDEAVGPFGVMGAYMQPQGHIQVIMNIIDFALNPQMALDAPRFQWIEGKSVAIEPGFPTHIARGLAAMGHDIKVSFDTSSFGRGQIILRDPRTGCLMGATESRCDGGVAAW